MWERRYGFPSSPRRTGQHRRYGEADLQRVVAVNRLRGQGLSLTAAINRARQADEPRPASLFAGLRRLHPQMQPSVLSKRALLELTRAMEDEYCAHGGGGLLVGSFQHERFFRHAERRWRELARTAAVAVAMADFAVLAKPAGGPVEVPVELGHPLSREWTLTIDAPGARACLAAWEQPTQSALPDPRRRFEVLWSFDPRVVRSSSALAAELLRGLAPAVAERIRGVIPEADGPPASDLAFATSLANRIVGYLVSVDDEREPAGGGPGGRRVAR